MTRKKNSYTIFYPFEKVRYTIHRDDEREFLSGRLSHDTRRVTLGSALEAEHRTCERILTLDRVQSPPVSVASTRSGDILPAKSDALPASSARL